MGKMVATSEIRYGKGETRDKMELKVFKVGEEVTGVDKEVMDGLVAGGSVIEVDKPVKVHSTDPTVVRDTALMLAGKYTGDRPAAVGNVPVAVSSEEDAQKIAAQEAEIAALKSQLAAAEKK